MKVSKVCLDLITKLLTIDDKERIDISKVLAHPFTKTPHSQYSDFIEEKAALEEE